MLEGFRWDMRKSNNNKASSCPTALAWLRPFLVWRGLARPRGLADKFCVCWRRGVAFGRRVGACVRDLAQVDGLVVVEEPRAVGGQEAVEPCDNLVW
jgi:hypothetical protein